MHANLVIWYRMFTVFFSRGLFVESTPFRTFWGIIYYNHFLSGDHFLSNLGIISGQGVISRPVSSAGLYSPYLTLMCNNYMCNKKACKWLIVLKIFGLNVDQIETLGNQFCFLVSHFLNTSCPLKLNGGNVNFV